MANYQIFKPVVAGAGFGTGAVFQEIVKPGVQIIAVTFVTLPNTSPGHVYLYAGNKSNSDPIRINGQGVSWLAPRDVDTDRLIPHEGGLALGGDDLGALLADWPNIEIYLEKPAHAGG